MPRNGSGTFTVTNTYTDGQTITAAIVNTNFSDLGTEMTKSLCTDGQSTMTGQIKAANGSVGTPSISFGSDTDTGFYRKSTGTIGITVDGAEVAEISAKGSTLIPTGVMMPYVATTAPTGWVRANGRTIGNAASSATERANADCETLFYLLWAYYVDGVCPVSGGRGASSAADWGADKKIGLPDLRGRGFFGLDDMGSTAASRLGTIITASTTNGATGGSETVTLTAGQLPIHEHTLSNHTHGVSGTTAAEVSTHAHTFSGTTTTDGAHTHSEVQPIAGGNSGAGGAGSGTPSATTTGSGGSHSHTYSGTTSTQSDAHTHAFSVTSDGPSTVSTGSLGFGEAHSNMSPAFLTTFIIKL